MSNLSLFTADHHGFYHNGNPFFPLIQEQASPHVDGANVVILRLPARLNNDLNWAEEKKLATQIIASGKAILWEIDLGLSDFQFTPDHSAAFFSFSIAIEEFTKTIWPQFQQMTLGVSLYSGNFPSKRNFPFIHWESAFSDWLEEFNVDSLEYYYDLYCIQMLSEYLNRLISFLPESILPFALIDATPICSPGKIAHLFSKERFEFIQLVLKGTKFFSSGICWEEDLPTQGIMKQPSFVPSLGLYLPKDESINTTLIKELDQMIFYLHGKQIPFRMIPEEKLTEQWDGIEKLMIPSHPISVQGRRKLLGFIAAGGIVTTLEGEEFKFS